jgi:hypothetical protein
MPAKRVYMRRVREILRLKFAADLPNREIARLVGTAPSTVRAALERFQAAALTWPLPEQVSEVIKSPGESHCRSPSTCSLGPSRSHRIAPIDPVEHIAEL